MRKTLIWRSISFCVLPVLLIVTRPVVPAALPVLTPTRPYAEAMRRMRSLVMQSAPVVCIDPGHAKATVGASGKHLAEYKVCWLMAQKLRAELQQRGVTVVLTKRNQNEDVPNEMRAEIANRNRANLLLRLHCDAGRDSGIATFYPNRQGVRNGVRGPSREVMEASRADAFVFHAALIRSLQGALPNRGVRGDSQTAVGSKQGALTGSIYAQVPVLLVEMAVITNRRDEAFLASSNGSTLR